MTIGGLDKEVTAQGKYSSLMGGNHISYDGGSNDASKEESTSSETLPEVQRLRCSLWLLAPLLAERMG